MTLYYDPFESLQTHLRQWYGKKLQKDDYLFLVLPEDRIIGFRVGSIQINNNSGAYFVGGDYVKPVMDELGKVLSFETIRPANKRFSLYDTATKYLGAPNKGAQPGKFLLNQRGPYRPKDIVTQEQLEDMFRPKEDVPISMLESKVFAEDEIYD